MRALQSGWCLDRRAAVAGVKGVCGGCFVRMVSICVHILLCLVKWYGVFLTSKLLRCRFLKMRNIGRRSLESTVESYLFGKRACHSFAAAGKTIGRPQ